MPKDDPGCIKQLELMPTNLGLGNVASLMDGWQDAHHRHKLSNKGTSATLQMRIVRSLATTQLRLTAGGTDPYQDFVNRVNKARNDRKTFSICGNFNPIRRALAERGWMEKPRPYHISDRDQIRQLEQLPNAELYDSVMRGGEHGDRCRRALISKLLTRHQVDFYWDYSTNPFAVLSDKLKRTLVNRYPGGCTARAYGSKAGLCDALSESHWYFIDGVAAVRHPRTYNISRDEERNAFIEDYRMTAAASLLKWTIARADAGRVDQPVISDAGKIPVAVFNFAMLQCQRYGRKLQHRDIDDDQGVTIDEAEGDQLGTAEHNVKPTTKNSDWDVYLDKYCR